MFKDAIIKLWGESGFLALNWQYLAMIVIACILVYLAIVKKFEPLLLLPIAFGMLLANLPFTGLMDPPRHLTSPADCFIIYIWVWKKGVYPSLIFLGIGAMTDFGPLIARPISLLLGAAAQFG
jgi:oxaloacetate decarboxylase beta subunit